MKNGGGDLPFSGESRRNFAHHDDFGVVEGGEEENTVWGEKEGMTVAYRSHCASPAREGGERTKGGAMVV